METRMRKRLAVLLLVTACSSSHEPEVEVKPQALNGFEGEFEFALDIPWRMEPLPGGGYDPVPINISIHDEDTNVYSPEYDFDEGRAWTPRLGDFCELRVSRWVNGAATATQTFDWDEMAWFEKTSRSPDALPGDPQPPYWPTVQEGLPLPWHGSCYPAGESCDSFRTIRDTSEWHAMFHWPDTGLPGSEVVLQLVAVVSAEVGGCEDPDGKRIELRNYAKVFWSPNPLPRFEDDRWLYGDLHYHSQGTDNEGESAYSYRAVVEAMGAMGIDFTYATDHASDSRQIVDIDLDASPEEYRGLRDMDQRRWDAALEKLHGPTGANMNMSNWWPSTRPRVPRLFLGGEVDVMPEVEQRPTQEQDAGELAWWVPFGNGAHFSIGYYVCDGILSESVFGCPADDASELDLIFIPFQDVNGQIAWTPRDTQSISLQVGRQHLVYLPRYPDQPLGFVSSHTGPYGGATRHLVENSGVLPEIEQKHGLAFLAHPLDGGGGKGPGSLPYSWYEYRKIFDQQSFTGLQFWNEDTRFVAKSGDGSEWDVTGFDWASEWGSGGHVSGWIDGHYDFVPIGKRNDWRWTEDRSGGVDSSLHHGSATWDRLLRWGLDVNRTDPLWWLEDGEPRRLFMAGGSDAHGDFNYRREGYATETTMTTDTAFAKVRNLVLAGDPRPPCNSDVEQGDTCPPAPPELQRSHSQDQVAEALGEGRFAVTDGPALRVMVDRDRDTQIDDLDTQMGGIVNLYNDEDLPIIIQWDTTQEFGAIDRIDLYIGVDSEPECEGELCGLALETRARTYAPVDHGVRMEITDELRHTVGHGTSYPQNIDMPANECNGVCQMADGYWLPNPGPRAQLRIIPTQAQAMAGFVRINLDLDQFPVADANHPNRRVQRAYVRAFARTKKSCDQNDPNLPEAVKLSGDCAPRYAFTNPVWALRDTWTPALDCPLDSRALDADFDGVPDVCDAFPNDPTGTSWSRRFGGLYGSDEANGVAWDDAGYLWEAGRVYGSGSIEVNGTPSSQYVGNNWDGLVAKYMPGGGLYQRVLTGGSGTAVLNDIAVDGAGNAYVAGRFSGYMSFGAYARTGDGTDGFIAKIDGNNLNVLWVMWFIGSGMSEPTSIAVTASGEIAVAGTYSGTMTTPAGNLPVASGASDCFVIRVQANGAIASQQRIGGTGTCIARDVGFDGINRFYVGADVTGQTQIGFITRNNAAGTGMVTGFANGNGGWWWPTWTTWFGGTGTGQDASVGGIAVTALGDVYVGGAFATQLMVERQGAGALWWAWSAGGRDGYIAKLNNGTGDLNLSFGSSMLGGPSDDFVSDVAVNGSGELVVSGAFMSSWFWAGGATMNLTGYRDGFLALFDGNGGYKWGRDFGLTGDTMANAAAISPQHRMAVAGGFSGTARIDDQRTLQTAGARDGFVAAFPPLPQPPQGLGN
jgi:hypothetical protein